MAWPVGEAGPRQLRAPIGYLGNSEVFDRAVAEFSDSYADPDDRDDETFKKAVAGGRLEAAISSGATTASPLSPRSG